MNRTLMASLYWAMVGAALITTPIHAHGSPHPHIRSDELCRALASDIEKQPITGLELLDENEDRFNQNYFIWSTTIDNYLDPVLPQTGIDILRLGQYEAKSRIEGSGHVQHVDIYRRLHSGKTRRLPSPYLIRPHNLVTSDTGNEAHLASLYGFPVYVETGYDGLEQTRYYYDIAPIHGDYFAAPCQVTLTIDRVPEVVDSSCDNGIECAKYKPAVNALTQVYLADIKLHEDNPQNYIEHESQFSKTWRPIDVYHPLLKRPDPQMLSLIESRIRQLQGDNDDDCTDTSVARLFKLNPIDYLGPPFCVMSPVTINDQPYLAIMGSPGIGVHSTGGYLTIGLFHFDNNEFKPQGFYTVKYRMAHVRVSYSPMRDIKW